MANDLNLLPSGKPQRLSLLRWGKPQRTSRPHRLRILALSVLGLVIGSGANAKTPGATYCFNDVCHRVLTLSETTAAIGRITVVESSFYGEPDEDAYNPRSETSSGEMFDPDKPDTVASPIYPDGTRIAIWNEATCQAAVARVTNAGPYMGERKLDVSRALAERLGFRVKGVAKLHVMVLDSPSPEQARYRRDRQYDRVAGPIGSYASAQAVLAALGQASIPPSTSIMLVALMADLATKSSGVWPPAHPLPAR